MSEQQIRLRGRAAEMKWSSDKCQQSTKGKLYLKHILFLLTLLFLIFDLGLQE
jgi:hypothetical protein